GAGRSSGRCGARPPATARPRRPQRTDARADAARTHARRRRDSGPAGLNWLQMARDPAAGLTPRQREILARVVEEYIATGQPVGSRYLVERAGLKVSPSTVRNELAELEARGLLTHPHTSAGRVPTELAYRLHADELLARQEQRPGSFPLDLSELRREIDSALETTSEVLSHATHMLAVLSDA